MLLDPLVINTPNTSREHDGLDPFPTLSIRHIMPKGPRKSANQRFAEFVPVIWRTVTGSDEYLQWTREISRVHGVRIFPGSDKS